MVANRKRKTDPAAFLRAGAQAAQQGLPIVLATRATSGRVIMTPGEEANGFIVSDDLLPQKAPILLLLALTATRDWQAMQEMFYQY
jgi:L-asparaginase